MRSAQGLDLAGWRLWALAATLSAGVLAGCQQQKRQPFADVDESTRTQPTQQVATAGAGTAEAQPAAAQPAVQEPAPAAAAQSEPPAPVVIQPAPVVAEPAPIVVEPLPVVAGPRPQPTTFPASPHWVVSGDRRFLVRAWPQSTSYRPDGNTMAGPTYWPIVPASTRYEEWNYILFEPLEFLGNVVLLPIRAVERPPWAKVVYSSVGPPLDEHVLYGQPWLEQPQAPAPSQE